MYEHHTPSCTRSARAWSSSGRTGSSAGERRGTPLAGPAARRRRPVPGRNCGASTRTHRAAAVGPGGHGRVAPRRRSADRGEPTADRPPQPGGGHGRRRSATPRNCWRCPARPRWPGQAAGPALRGGRRHRDDARRGADRRGAGDWSRSPASRTSPRSTSPTPCCAVTRPGGGTVNLRRTAVHGIREDHPFYPLGRLGSFVPSTPQAQGLRQWPVARGAGPVRRRGLAGPGVGRDGAGRRVRRPLAHHHAVEGPRHHPGHRGLLAVAEARAVRATMTVSLAEELVAAGRGQHRQRPPLHPRAHHGRDPAAQPAAARRCRTRAPSRSAHRYLPAQSGVSGDWFDVIPLPGSRVALVVGDVVGHGLHAAATMGRLRTAVHNFSAFDVPPDELLGYLDELVNRIDQEETEGDRRHRCHRCHLSVRDLRPDLPALHLRDAPVTRRPHWSIPTARGVPRTCRPARRSGWAGCRSRRARGAAGRRLPSSCSTPTGWSRTATRDLDIGIEPLRAPLWPAPRPRSPEENCRPVLDALLPEHPSDDVALLIARPGCSARTRSPTWDVPSEPAAVAASAPGCTAPSWRPGA